MKRRFKILLVLAAAAALLTVPAAQAANIVPNPSFELLPSDCGGTPICYWEATTAAAALSRDTTYWHNGGAASLKVTLTNVSFNGARTVCIVEPLAKGQHLTSFWYRTTDANVGDLVVNLQTYTSSDCSGAIAQSQVPVTATPVKDGFWHEVSGLLENKLTTIQSFKLVVFFECAVCNAIGGTATAYFDDVSFDAVTAVELTSFTATRGRRDVQLRWRTGAEVDVLGFHVYRERAGKRVRVDRQLIPANGSVSGARYYFVDRRAPRGKLTYRLQAIGTDGSRSWYGRAIVAR